MDIIGKVFFIYIFLVMYCFNLISSTSLKRYRFKGTAAPSINFPIRSLESEQKVNTLRRERIKRREEMRAIEQFD